MRSFDFLVAVAGYFVSPAVCHQPAGATSRVSVAMETTLDSRRAFRLLMEASYP
jgi:hypothetical protein